MSRPSDKARRSGARPAQRRTRGAGILILLVLLIFAGFTVAASAPALYGARQSADRRTAEALQRARDALIGRALADDNRPGSLPCPARDPGGQVPLFAGNHCPSYIGYFPWRTMRTGELRDARGDLLWYALTPALRDSASAQPINDLLSETLSADGQGDVLALLFSPGAPLAGQERTPDAAISSYLEGANIAGSGVYASGKPGGESNDRLLPMRHAALFAPLARRILAEMRGPLGESYGSAGLYAYYFAQGGFPWPDSDGDGESNVGADSGRIPCQEIGRVLQGAVANGGGGSDGSDDARKNFFCPAFPEWLENNRWHERVTYRRLADDRASLSLGEVSLLLSPCAAAPC